MKRHALFFLGIVLILGTFLSGAGVTFTARAQGPLPQDSLTTSEWTFMVYLDADNDLESAGIDDFLEMAQVGSSDDIQIVVQMDRIPGYSLANGDWTSTKRFHVAENMEPWPGSAEADIGEANMGDPDTLVDFAQWAMGAYPAERYALVLWDHGTGWVYPVGPPPPVKDVAFDDSSGGDALDMPELRQALAAITDDGAQPLDLIGFDACLMAMIEVDAECRPYSSVRVGSEDSEPFYGWPYHGFLDDLVADPEMPAAGLGEEIVAAYYASYGEDEVQSAVDLGSAYDALESAVDGLALALLAAMPNHRAQLANARTATEPFHSSHPYVDLYDLAEQIATHVDDATVDAAAAEVMAAVDAAVIAEEHGSLWPYAHGISIYFPSSEGAYDLRYQGDQGVLRFTITTYWDDCLWYYYGHAAPQIWRYYVPIVYR